MLLDGEARRRRNKRELVDATPYFEILASAYLFPTVTEQEVQTNAFMKWLHLCLQLLTWNVKTDV